MNSLFIGRYQPLHEGHIKLIQKVLDKGKPVVVALRDTPIDEKNPYTIEERKEMFQKVFGDRVKIIVIPDIAEVCYGRKAGWKIREIRLDEETEKLSATRIRERNQGFVIWLTGLSGAGKTTIANVLKQKLDTDRPITILDGDELRKTISADLGFSRKDREIHNARVIKYAKTLMIKGHIVIIALISPIRKVRETAKKELKRMLEIYIK